MIALVGYDVSRIVLGVLFVSLAVLVVAIAYKKLLQYLGKGTPNKQDFCVLYTLEENPSKGEVEFYFTCEEDKDYAMWILDADMNDAVLVQEGLATRGGTIVRFDTTSLGDGHYYFCLKTSNQKTMKKMQIRNS